MAGVSTQDYIDRIGKTGFDHIEADLLVGRHATIFVWRSFDRLNGKAFGGEYLVDALRSAALWTEQQASAIGGPA